MPTRTVESPPRQQDGAPGDSRPPRSEVRQFATRASEMSRNQDTDAIAIDDPDINTHGSER